MADEPKLNKVDLVVTQYFGNQLGSDGGCHKCLPMAFILPRD